MPLFQQSVQKKYIKDLDKAKVEIAYQKLLAHFGNAEMQENIRNSKEEQYQEGFLRELFVDVLGFVLNPQPNFNLITEQKNEKNSKKADGAILRNGKPLAVIELKSIKTTDLQSIEIQAFSYKNNQTDCVYVITSNFQKLRFYIENAVDFEEFDLFDLSKERFELLYLCLHADNVLSDLPLRIKQASLEREENITKKLYADYSLFKQALFKDITDNNISKGFKPLELFKKTQKLLDRFLFIFFAEDKGLLPPNSVSEILNQWDKLKDLDAYQPLYNRFKLYFGYLNNGHKGKIYDIFAYNGGLFAPDELLDNLKITDGILYQHCRVLSHYDFDTEVDTNILGHIFEHSLNEVDEVAAQSKGFKPLENSKTIGKRKKDGIFYTPRYITKYIVESTVGELCKQKKETLGLDNETLIKADTKKDRKLYQTKIGEYRNWLLHLTILDPACGSGAFLNQALEFLIQEHRLIDTMTAMLFGDSLIMTDNITEILENNIFGVDINEESVEIARLAMWLRTAKVGRKLNDLSRNIKCGNSLISDPSVAGDLAFDWHKAFPKIFKIKEKTAFHIVLTTHNSRTSQRMIDYKVEKGEPLNFTLEEEIAMTEIIGGIIKEKNYNCLEYNICKDHVHLILVCEAEELNDIVKTIKGKSAYLFNHREVQSNGFQPIANSLGQGLSNGLKPIGVHNGSVWSQKFFRAFMDEWELQNLSNRPGWIFEDSYLQNALYYVKNNRKKHQLPESAALEKLIASFCVDLNTAYAEEYKGGFDVVIGNPPYVVYIKSIFGDNVLNYIIKNYEYSEYNPNTYALFTELAINLLKKSGYLGFIIPNTWMQNKYFSKMRKGVYSTKVNEIVYLKNSAFEEVVETVILLLENTITDTKDIKLTTDILGNQFTVQNFKKDDYLNGYNPFVQSNSTVITNLEAKYKLKNNAIVYRGLETKDNEKWLSTIKKDENHKPILLGKDVNRYSTEFSGTYVNFIKKEMKSNANEDFYNKGKILMRRTGSTIIVDIDLTKSMALKNLYLIVPKNENDIYCITAQLNSKLFDYYHKSKTSGENKAFAQFTGEYIENFPCIIGKQDEFKKLIEEIYLSKNAEQKLSTRFLKLFTSMGNPMGFNPLKITISKKLETWYNLTFGEFRKELEKQKIAIPIKELMDYQDLFDTNATQIKEIQTKIADTEKAIDKLVYALYDLTDEEIQLIENQ